MWRRVGRLDSILSYIYSFAPMMSKHYERKRAECCRLFILLITLVRVIPLFLVLWIIHISRSRLPLAWWSVFSSSIIVYELGAIAEYIHHTVISLEVKQLDDQSGKLSTLFYFLCRNNCNQNLLIGTTNFWIISRSEKARDTDIREKLKRDYIFLGGGQ